MSRTRQLEAEAEAQREALRLQLAALRRPARKGHSPARGTRTRTAAAGLSMLLMKRFVLPRSPAVFYGWLLYRAWKALAPLQTLRAGARRLRRVPPVPGAQTRGV